MSEERLGRPGSVLLSLWEAHRTEWAGFEESSAGRLWSQAAWQAFQVVEGASRDRTMAVFSATSSLNLGHMPAMTASVGLMLA